MAVNFLSCFVFFINSKAENKLKFQQHSAPAQLVHTSVKIIKLLCCETPDFIIAPTMHQLTYPTSVLLIIESWQCYRSVYVGIICEMLIS